MDLLRRNFDRPLSCIGATGFAAHPTSGLKFPSYRAIFGDKTNDRVLASFTVLTWLLSRSAASPDYNLSMMDVSHSGAGKVNERYDCFTSIPTISCACAVSERTSATAASARHPSFAQWMLTS
jgi:hypothetical protein